MKVGVVLVGGKLACFHSSAWLGGAIEAGWDWQRGNGNIKCHKPCELNNKNVQRDSYCVPFHRLPQPASSSPLCIPLQPSSLPVLHRLVSRSQLNSLGRLGPDRPDSLWSCRGRVVVMLHQAPKNALYPSPSASLFELFTTCSRVRLLAHNPTLLRPLLCSLDVCGGRCAGSCMFFYTTACPSGSRWCVPQWCSFTLFKHKVGNLKTTLFVPRHWGCRLAIEVYIRSGGGHLWFNRVWFFRLNSLLLLPKSKIDCVRRRRASK